MDAKNKWDKKYVERIEDKAEPTANSYLKQLIKETETSKTALELASGLGGNSLFLARKGYEVQSIDISDVALTYLKEKATAENLPITTKALNLTDPLHLNKITGSFDLIVITNYLNRELFPFIKQRVKKGGYFFMATFYKSPLTRENGMPEKYKLNSGELKEEFSDWNIIAYEENEQTGKQMIYCRKE